MINPKKAFNIYEYLEIFLRRKWYALIPFLTVILIMTAYLIFCPRKYTASTLILVTPQKVPEEFVRPTVTARIEDRLQSIAQESLSRTRLEQIISQLNLYESEKKWMKQEEIVELMRKNTKVEIKGREGYFTISFTGEEPRVVTTVTNRLASMFIEENLKFREQQAQGTTEFLSQELKAKKALLEDLEREITAYKRRYMGELPEQREANLRILEQLQLNFQRIGEMLRAAQDRKLIIQKQLLEAESTAGPTVAIPSVQLDELKNQLAEMKARYTDLHPDIVTIKRKIDEMEGKTEGVDLEKNPRYRELRGQLTAVDIEIPRYQQEEAKIQNHLRLYRARIENTPVREQEMTAMTREYQNTKASYETLLKKSQEAQQAENLEFRQKGEQFKVVDPARIPERPVRPDIPKVLLIGFVFGLAAATVSVIVRESIDHSFLDAEDVQITLGLKVLANIPKFENKAA
jgi:polysaccharide chain length determinant protein (PEP-CTERM system associated)